MKPATRTAVVALALFGLLAVSVFSMMPNAAEALSAVTFTNKGTITSASTTTFDRVYENGTNSIIYLDVGSNSTVYQRTYTVATEAISSTSGSVSVSGNTLTNLAISPIEGSAASVYVAGTATNTPMNVVTSGSAQAICGAGCSAQSFAETVVNTSSVLYGQSVNSATLRLSKTGAPTGTATVGVFDGSNNVVYTFGTIDVATLTGSATNYTFTNTSASRTLAVGDHIGIKYTGGSGANTVDVQRDAGGPFDGNNSIAEKYDAGWVNPGGIDVRMTLTGSILGIAKISPATLSSQTTSSQTSSLTPKDIVQSTTKLYIPLYDSSSNGALTLGSMTKAFGSWTTAALYTGTAPVPVGTIVKSVVVDGSPDTIYTFFTSGATAVRAVKYTSSATLLGTAMTNSGTADFNLIPMSGSIIIQTGSNTYSLNTSTDAITQLYSTTFPTRYPQTFTVNNSTRSYTSNPVMIANSTYAINYVPSTGAGTQTGVLIETATAPTLTPWNPSKGYFLSGNSVITDAASAGAMTWTIKTVGARVELAVTPYTEKLGVNLVQNSTILSANVVKLVCDNGEYGVSLTKFSIGSDNDCTYWKTLDISSSSIGRMLPYERTKDVVHAADYTNYNIHLNAANPQLYSVTLEYNDKEVDYNIFDDGDNAQLRLLYGQCYQLSYKEILSGDEVQSSRVCADDVIFKESILSSTLGLIFWTSPWGATHTYNDTSLILNTIVRHLPVNYDYNVKITDKNDLVIVNANVTSPQEVSSQSYNLTAYDANKPFHLSIYNDEDKRIYQAYLDDRPQYLKPIADLFAEQSFAGWNLIMFAPLIFAAMFTRNTAGIGAGLTAAFIAFMNWLGLLDIATSIIGVIIVIGALAVIAYRKQFD